MSFIEYGQSIERDTAWCLSVPPEEDVRDDEWCFLVDYYHSTMGKSFDDACRLATEDMS